MGQLRTQVQTEGGARGGQTLRRQPLPSFPAVCGLRVADDTAGELLLLPLWGELFAASFVG